MPEEELTPIQKLLSDLGVISIPEKKEEVKEIPKEEKPSQSSQSEVKEAEKITRPFFIHGRKSNIGPLPTKLFEDNVELMRGVNIWADRNNTDVVYIGKEGMNLDEADTMCGFPLYPNSSKFIEAEKVNLIWVASKTPGQRVYFEGI